MSKLLMQAKAAPKPRPYWHVDAKWVFSILFSIVLGLWLLLVVAHRVTSKEVAVPTIKAGLQTFISSIPVGDTSQNAIDDFKQQIAESPTKSLQLIPGAPAITEADLSLSPEQLRDKIFSPLLEIAEPLYDKGARGLAEEQTSDKAAQDKLVNDLSVVSVLSKQNHNAIGQWVLVGLFVVLAAGVPVVFFSYRFGRIVTPALIMLLVGLPGLVVFSMLAAPATNAPAAADAQNYFELAAASKGALLPAATAGQQLYLAVVLIALGLLVATALGKMIYAAIKSRSKSQKPA